MLGVAPLVHILGLGLLPDTLLMLWVALVMLQTLQLIEAPPKHALAPPLAQFVREINTLAAIHSHGVGAFVFVDSTF